MSFRIEVRGVQGGVVLSEWTSDARHTGTEEVFPTLEDAIIQARKEVVPAVDFAVRVVGPDGATYPIVDQGPTTLEGPSPELVVPDVDAIIRSRKN
jgi:hypothetical protein